MDGWEDSALSPPPPPANAQEPGRSPVSQNNFAAGNVGAVDGNSSSGGGGLSGADSNGVPATPPTAAAPALANLPAAATHSYLGEATTGSSLSRKDLDVGSTVDMPILSLPGVVLFPGESLPLRLHNPAYALLAESLLGSGAGAVAVAGARAGARGRERDCEGGDRQAARHLGVVNRLDSRSGGLLVRTSPVGTTAEIRSGYGGSAGDDADGGAGFAVMARGRHRFRLVEDLGWRRGVRYWRVTICPDLCPGPLRPPIPRAFRDFPGPARGGRTHWAMAMPRFAVEKNSPAGLAARAVSLLREQGEPLPHAPLPPPPGGAAEVGAGAGTRGGAAMGVPDERGGIPQAQSEEPSPPPPPGGSGGLPPGRRGGSADAAEVGLRRQPQAGGCRGQDEGDEKEEEDEEEEDDEEDGEDRVTRRRRRLDPTLFSFWLAANLPLDDDARQRLLLLDSVVMRLRLEVKHLEKRRRRALCCAGCGIGVAWEGDVFTLPGAEGVVGAYVNPLGYVHQTVTVRNARNLVLVGAPEEEHTWFPGYAWTAAYCERCPHHLGWRFTAVNRAAFGSHITRRDQQQEEQQQQQQQQPHRPIRSSPSSSASLSSSASPSSSPSSSSSSLSAARGGASGMGAGGVGAGDENGGLGPPFFFGLCRSSLVGEVRDP